MEKLVFPFSTLIALALFKLILTPTSLGSGFAGGVIAPALLVGSAYTFTLPSAGIHLKPGTFTVEKPGSEHWTDRSPNFGPD
jgi:H+/Cl- antiporter ClcA